MVASANGEVIAADKLGKAKTAVTMLSLCGYLLFIAMSIGGGATGVVELVGTISWALMIAAVVLTVISGFQYFWNARHIVFRV